MGKDIFARNSDYSIYLPAISSVYARFASGYSSIEEGPRKGVFPEWAQEHGFRTLDFLDKERGIFNYSHALYSAGHACLDLEKFDKNEKMISRRDKDNTFILGDSGGYQVTTGVLKFPWDDINGPSADKIRHKIMLWLEESSDYSMLFDFPTAGILNPNSPMTTFGECLEGSINNYKYFLKHRTGKTKYLNVLQGRSISESELWFNEVKDFPFEGWAFGDNMMRDFEMILYRLIKMRDGKYFEENSQGNKRPWLHFLGQSRLTAACAFTTLQRKLRQQVDQDITISFDSASAFITTANGQCYTRNVFENKRFSYLTEKAPDDKNLLGSDLPFPWSSTVGDLLTMKDLCVKGFGYKNKHGKEFKTSWDSYSYIQIMAHNVEAQITAIQQANRIHDMPVDLSKHFIPHKIIEFDSIVEEVFNSETPFDVIKKHHKVLNKLTGVRTGGGVNLSDESTVGNLNDLFEFDASTLKSEYTDERPDPAIFDKIINNE